MSETYDVAIIGAGPAGMEAAITASRAGAKTVLIDAFPEAGGQYYKPVPAAFEAHGKTRTEEEGGRLVKSLAGLPVTKIYNAQVWGIFKEDNMEDWMIALYGQDAPGRVFARATVLANGAYEIPVAFPGWTLPGVITCGAALTLVKTQRVQPGRRALVTGAGPLMLSAAAHMIEAGMDIAGVCELNRVLPRGVVYGPAMLGHRYRLSEGIKYIRTIIRNKTPYRIGWSVVEARGDEHVEEAVIAKVDESGAPIAGTERTLRVDTIVCGYGLSPNTELAGMLNCKLDYQKKRGGWVPVRDEWLQTSTPGIYAAGDCAGVCGAENSRLEGRLAGAAAGLQTGFITRQAAEEIKRDLAPGLEKQRRFGDLMGDLFSLKQGVASLATDETILCRCEEITKQEVLAAIQDECDSVTWVKRKTRSGMGMCQGRTCGHLIAQLLAQETGQDREALSPDTHRPPVRPIPLRTLEENP